MKHYLILAVLPVCLLLGAACPATAWVSPPPLYLGSERWAGQDLSGTYINTSNGRTCEVSRRGRGYRFVNENGTPARFEFVGPRTLRLISGDWNPATVATVGRDQNGRRLIRFQEPGQPAGIWVREE